MFSFSINSSTIGIFWSSEVIFQNGGCQKVMNVDYGMRRVMITSGVHCSMIMISKAGIARTRDAIFATLLVLGSSCRRIPTGRNGKP